MLCNVCDGKNENDEKELQKKITQNMHSKVNKQINKIPPSFNCPLHIELEPTAKRRNKNLKTMYASASYNASTHTHAIDTRRDEIYGKV